MAKPKKKENPTPNKNIEIAAAPTTNVPAPIQYLKKNFVPTQLFRVQQDVGKWFAALRTAENVFNPNRYSLYTIYNDLLLDPHLSSLINSRKHKTLSKQFKVVDSQGNEVEEKTKFLDTTWFETFINLALDAKLWGHSLIQFDNIIDGTFSGVELVDRTHVKPEFGLFVDNYAAMEGESYNDPKYADWLVEVVFNSPRELGLLNKVAAFVLYKRHCMSAYAEFVEVFGSPLRIGKTDIRNEELRNNMEQFLVTMGTSTWGLFDTTDNVEFIETSAKDGKVYEGLLRYIDEQVSKLILGQTMTSDNGSSRSQATVHEAVAEEYCQADIAFISRIVNEKLFPLLNKHGLGFEGLKFQYDYSEKISLMDQFQIDAKLLDFYEIPEDYITKKYGTPVIKKAAVAPQAPASGTDNYSPLNFLEL